MQQRCALALHLVLAVAIAVAAAIAGLAMDGIGSDGIRLGLRLTARWSFLLFWLAYSGRALEVLFGSAFRGVTKGGREFGLAFAAAHSVHIALVVWLWQVEMR